MKKILFVLLLLVSTFSFSAELYSKSFGNNSNPALIFLHGGPGYNSSVFEVTAAKRLADAGFYVIIYDRRGEGRSADATAQFNFKESFTDIESLFTQYEIEKASFIGHSFGGILATKFAQKNKKLVESIILVGAPVSLQESFETIIASSEKIYQNNGDKTNLKYLRMLEEIDSESLEYAVYCFSHAMQNGFYSTDSVTEDANEIYARVKSDSIMIKYASTMTQAPTMGFWKNEAYTSINLSKDLRNLVNKGVPVYGLYGKEDGLYSSEQISNLSLLIGEENLMYLDKCSHSVFVDQQNLFIQSLVNWIQ